MQTASDRNYPPYPRAATGVVVFRDQSVLLIKRGKEPNKGATTLPGGAQELGETVRDAALREVREETGIMATIIDLVDVVDLIDKDQSLPDISLPAIPDPIKFHYTLIDFWAEWHSGELKPGSDAEAAFWHPIERLHELKLWQETHRVIQKALSMRNASL